MVDVLNSVLIKHDDNFKSLTKIALSQILLKIIYESKNGTTANSIKSKIEDYVGVGFNIKDIETSLNYLKNEQKINFKANKYYISEKYKPELDKSVNESEGLHDDVIKNWFSKTDTYQSENGSKTLYKWFNKLMVNFFKEYRYDWINDLRKKRVNGKRESFNIEKILASCFEKIDIQEKDKEFLKSQFSKFLESARKEDNELLWFYGVSMFSATILTAKNYADDFSLNMFKNSNFILDTNILMTIGLEGHDFYYAFEPIEKIFSSLNITPLYFYITKEEYRRAVGNKRQATKNTLDRFGYDVVKEAGCGIIATAIKRKCVTQEEFSRFFDELENIPDVIHNNIKIKCEDYKELHNAIEQGQLDEDTLEKINIINKNRTGRNKSKNVLAHDSGLVQGVKFLNQSKKSWILTKDGTIREYANENTLRDDDPIAIGLDSFIQMMAINNGNISNSTTNFAPLFAKIVQLSLLPEKHIFKVEDLDFILDTRVEIEKLKKEDIIEIAKNVNKLRVQHKPEDDIALEVRRYFQKKEVDYETEKTQIDAENFSLKQNNERTNKKLDNISSELFNSKYQEEKSKLKKSIKCNRLKFIGIPLFVIAIIVFVFKYFDFNQLGLIGSIISDILASIVIGLCKKPKLFFTEKDDEMIKKQIKEDIDKM